MACFCDTIKMPSKLRRPQQDSQLCSLCRKAVGSFETMHKGQMQTGELAHAKCLASRVCCFCGQHGLTLDCGSADCMRVVHSWCLGRFTLNQNVLCDVHSQFTLPRKKEINLSLIREAVSRISLSGFWQNDNRTKEPPGKLEAGALCTGNIFWFIISSQYFPSLAVLKNPPYFPMFPVIDFTLADFPAESRSESFIDDQLATLESQLKRVQHEISELCPTISKTLSKPRSQLSEEDQILAEIRQHSYDKEFDCLLPHREPEAPSKAEHSSLALRKEQAIAEEQCSVCGDTDYEDDDILAVCSVRLTQLCSLIVHQKCYGIYSVSETWVCDVCVNFGKAKRHRVPCALCPIRGGALKMTVHSNDGTLDTPNYVVPRKRLRDDLEQPEHPRQVWVHVFCALNIEGVSMSSQQAMQGIDLKSVDKQRFSMKCEICHKREGACLQCSYGKCVAAFHPECSKSLFVNPRGDQARIYCALHRPLKLRKVLDSRDKKLADDLNKFCKAFIRWETKVKAKAPRRRKDRTREGNSKPFSPDEDQALQYTLHKLICGVHLSQAVPFAVIVDMTTNSRRSQVQLRRPQCFNMVVPEVILEERLRTDYRTVEECYRRYSEILFHRWKSQLTLHKEPVLLYAGRDPAKQQALLARFRAKTQEQRLAKRAKLPALMPVGPECTVERYCLCKQPYYFYLARLVNETEESYARRVLDNTMISCSKCEEWFHFGCVGYTGTPEQADNDDLWECPGCKKKPARAAKAGVRTRRQMV